MLHSPAILLTLLAALTALAVTGCHVEVPGQPAAHASQAPKSSGQSAIRVNVVHPAKKTLIRMVQQPGEVLAIEQTPILPKVSGYISKVYVDIGDRVPMGHLLAEISIPEYEQELQQKQAIVAQTEAETAQAQAAIKVAQAMLASAEANVSAAEAAVGQAVAELERADSELARVTELYDDKAITKKVLDESRAVQRSASAAKAQTEARIAAAKALVTEKMAGVEQAQADAKAVAAKQNVALADEQRLRAIHDYTRITAPYESVITERNIDTGHFVQPGKASSDKPLFTLARIDVVRIFVDVPEADAGLVVNEGEATIRIPAVGMTIPGRITRSGWTLNPATRTLRVAIDLPNEEHQLRPGLYVIADLKIAERKDVLALPKSATFVADQQTYCLTISPENKIERTKITIGLRTADDVEILDGVSSEARVIPANVTAYRPGQVVEVLSK